MNIKFNAVLNSFNSILNIISPIITFPYIARIFTVEQIGLLSYADSILLVFSVATNGGVLVYGLKKLSFTDNDQQTNHVVSSIYTFNFILSIIFGLVYLIFIILNNKLFENFDLYFIYFFALLLSFLNLVWVFQAKGKFKTITTRNLFTKIIFIGFLFILIDSSKDYLIWPLLIVIGNCLGNFFYLISLKSVLNIKIKLLPINFFKLLKDVKYIYFTGFLVQLSLVLDKFLIEWQFGVNILAFYSIPHRISKVFELLIFSVGVALVPELIRVYRNSSKVLVQLLLEKYFSIVIFSSFLFFLISYIFADELISLYVGDKFLLSSQFLKLFSGLSFFVILNTFLVNILIVNLGDEKVYLIFYFSFIVSYSIYYIMNYFFINYLLILYFLYVFHIIALILLNNYLAKNLNIYVFTSKNIKLLKVYFSELVLVIIAFYFADILFLKISLFILFVTIHCLFEFYYNTYTFTLSRNLIKLIYDKVFI